MNRAERRRTERESAKDPMISMRRSEIEALKKEATDKAVATAFTLMLGIPTMVLHDKYADLMRKVVDGKSREERFTDFCIDLYDSYDRGYLSLEDIKQYLLDETGVKIESKR
ncbi:hypothetical protein [Anaerosporobacter faecicola]|uniref:hypothetical protein n=1 Tax=Anaerosporobacter faecicola TaxID=2718714 RepID=UPI00143C3D57|nr:hypothetical protein [Anaerosporobacter faecicola]